MEDDDEPCPFCGEDAEDIDEDDEDAEAPDNWFGCNSDDCEIRPRITTRISIRNAKSIWNNRSDSKRPQLMRIAKHVASANTRLWNYGGDTVNMEIPMEMVCWARKITEKDEI